MTTRHSAKSRGIFRTPSALAIIMLSASIPIERTEAFPMPETTSEAMAEKTIQLIQATMQEKSFTPAMVERATHLPIEVSKENPGIFGSQGLWAKHWKYDLYSVENPDNASVKQMVFEFSPIADTSLADNCALAMSFYINRLRELGFEGKRRQNRLGSPRWWSFSNGQVSVSIYGGKNDDSSDDLACVEEIFIYAP